MPQQRERERESKQSTENSIRRQFEWQARVHTSKGEPVVVFLFLFHIVLFGAKVKRGLGRSGPVIGASGKSTVALSGRRVM
jgi:hypothetical protein